MIVALGVSVDADGNFLAIHLAEPILTNLQRYALRIHQRGIAVAEGVEADALSGEEHFSNVLVDGQPADPWVANNAMWSEGEFAPLVLSALNEHSAPRLTFRGETQLGASPALVFDYDIEAKNNLTWSWRVASVVYFPAYHGSIWIDKKTGQLRRFTEEASQIDHWVGYTELLKDTEYAGVQISELGKFVLPVRSRAVGCKRGMPFCSENVLTFYTCRKFAAKAKIVTGDPQP